MPLLTKHETTLLPPVQGRWFKMALQAIIWLGTTILLLLPKRPFGGGEIELIYDPANLSSPLNIHDQYLRT
ncbi:hypothetical protein [Erythrobacter mangrovi]|uniref:Uncharacterized protein n=1 Tax=Erythrobacter mangrovi TaxID=2739433 RepID=A0A7D3XIJ3_9SPHN|nr:hypothetical protein [Erythrobacter mangrovi]QKG72193.1 hypothetical protein HQR01_12920 [Erythrobacter mangrovi]